MEGQHRSILRIPVSTYRIQFSRDFTLYDAMNLVPYLKSIGITDLYASPCFATCTGSTHGYDIIDPNTINPEIGGEEAFNHLADLLRENGMGLILDVVPNHMCVKDRGNSLWMDVLENGPSAQYAHFFDINWNPDTKHLENKVLIPILGNRYGEVLENGELVLFFENGGFFVRYHDNVLPLLPETYEIILQKVGMPSGTESDGLRSLIADIISRIGRLPRYTESDPERLAERRTQKEQIKTVLVRACLESTALRDSIETALRVLNGRKGEPRSFDALDNLLNRQVWLVSHWRTATDEVNYRRFFDISTLAAIRVEDMSVFNATHSLVFRLIQEGRVTGLRIDHPDGLYDPLEYFWRLQHECFVRRGLHLRLLESEEKQLDIQSVKTELSDEFQKRRSADPSFKPFYIIGEKILTKNEQVPQDWPIFSSVGYASMNHLNSIFVDPANSKKFDDIYSRFIRSKVVYHELIAEKKRLVAVALMSAEVGTLAHYLNKIARQSRYTRDFTLNSLRTAIIETISYFPIYRTYLTPGVVAESDLRYIEQAISKARRKNAAVDASVYEFLQSVLQLRYPPDFPARLRNEWETFVMKFQQITGPVMAKGLEDTVFYIYNRLSSLNEVGGTPERFGASLDTFHGKNIETIKAAPYSQIATTTHDTKHSEDARARLNVISEIPDEWRRKLGIWSRLNRRKRTSIEGQTVPERNEEYLLYQSLLCIWPGRMSDETQYEQFKSRIREYTTKAVREAKINSSWTSPNASYEEGLMRFVDAILTRTAGNIFLKDLDEFASKITYFGYLNSLSQTVLKITSPGVPDFYQGTEMWFFTLVDPDNRRPIDFGFHMKLFAELQAAQAAHPKGSKEFLRYITHDLKDGIIKLYVTYVLLNYRKANRELFEDGIYIPATVTGKIGDCICSFIRSMGSKTLAVLVPRFPTRLFSQSRGPIAPVETWADSAFMLPADAVSGTYRNLFTDKVVRPSAEDDRKLFLKEIFSDFPVAVLEKWEQ
ncbi:MAG TPA: malto-oligosyltrehalose synthase [Syntrophorhabdaceae bacterium]|nr:malto-oligosyltrehalose synthase [Syntrophorhabdaceae bacterium]